MLTFDSGKPGRGGATANQLADLEARTAGVGRNACIREAYAIMRCPGRPCTKGIHCRQHGGVHRRERAHGRKRRRRGSDGSSAGPTVVHCHQGSSEDPPTPKMIFPTSPLLRSDLPREEGVTAYSAWHRSQVSTEEQKNHYTSAEKLALMHCLDLGILASNSQSVFKFYTVHDMNKICLGR
ncbi:hypothetical protein IWW34DRAFT_764976 [Fusarium oxysporum f. sp. albedinis]|nr:hypothetical protein IWW34DRAFT_764976 [Fusarium oxysporum f. sp. albedinis]KAJ0135062.1 Uncharacterized protein HZ326_21906 [Fusarium oxysporum f. sp. albedinis]